MLSVAEQLTTIANSQEACIQETKVYTMCASCRTTSVTIPGSIRSVSSSAAGMWTILGTNTLILNVTACGGDTVYSCVSSDATTSYSLSQKGNSMVVLTDLDGSSALTYAYQPGLPR